MIEEQKNDSQLMWDWHFECSWNIFYILIQLYNLKVKKKLHGEKPTLMCYLIHKTKMLNSFR